MKYVIDTCSLSYLEKFYSKLKDGHKLQAFIRNKIASGEIIIIDKVWSEITTPNLKSYLSRIAPKPTAHLLSNFHNTVSRWYTPANERFCGNNINRINAEKTSFENRYADLWLVLFCLDLINSGENIILITDESSRERNNRKLYKKIPTICALENITCKDITELLFNDYSGEIEIKVS